MPLITALISTMMSVANAQTTTSHHSTTQPDSELPPIRLKGTATVTEAEKQHIASLIRELAHVHGPWCGYILGWCDPEFAPMASMRLVDGCLRNHGPETPIPCPAFTELVSLGWKAMPSLLDSLEEATPTEFTLQRNKPKSEWSIEFVGGLWRNHFLEGNPANKREASLLNGITMSDDFDEGSRLNEYTFRVGDLCFAAIGQICNREYLRRSRQVRMSPVSSPVDDKQLAAEVRRIWKADDYRQDLFDSLVIDFNSRADESKGFFSEHAATRLLYYFPNEAIPLILARLKAMKYRISDPKERFERNGWVDSQFIKSINFTTDVNLRKEIGRAMAEASDPATFWYSLPAILKEDSKIASDRVSGFLESHPSPPGSCKGVICCEYMFAGGDSMLDVISPFLKDKTYFSHPYFVLNTTFNDFRVCDIAALAISKRFPEFKFDGMADFKTRDRQVETIREGVRRKLAPDG